MLFFFVFGVTQQPEFNYYFIYIEMLEIIVLLLKGFLCNTPMKNSWYMSNCIYTAVKLCVLTDNSKLETGWLWKALFQHVVIQNPTCLSIKKHPHFYTL